MADTPESSSKGSNKRFSDKVMIAIITVIGSILVAVVTTLGTIAANGKGINDNRQTLEELQKKAEALKKPDLPVGTVIASLLRPNEFAREVGDPDNFDLTKSKWILADGKPVPGTDWAKLRANADLPNLCGVFLRGKANGKRPGVAEVEPGEFQDEAVGPHQHKIMVMDPGTAGGGILWDQGSGAQHLFQADKLVAAWDGPETRPKNVTVNYFIRINN